MAIEDDEVRIFRALSENFNRRIIVWANRILDVVKRKAISRGIDPRYVLHIIFEQESAWFSMVGKNRLALQVATQLFIQWGDAGDLSWEEYDIPPYEKEQDVERVILETSIWAATTFKIYMASAWLNALKDVTPAMQKALVDHTKENFTFSTSFGYLCSMARRIIREHPRITRYTTWHWRIIYQLLADEAAEACPTSS